MLVGDVLSEFWVINVSRRCSEWVLGDQY